MRRDIFLHFLNRDTREVFDLYGNLKKFDHAQVMRRSLNACAILCEDHCVAPPGFLVEDQIAFELAENQQAYLEHGVIQLPMRENSLADFAEKKRVGYEPMRNRYSGLFDDTRIEFLGRHATGIIRRKSHITDGILKDWSSGAEVGKRIWLPSKQLLTASTIDLIAKIPGILDDRGVAVTWEAISPELPEEARPAKDPLRNTLQHIYFGQYCREFKLVAVTTLPYIVHDFRITSEPGYNYRWLTKFLDVFGVRSLLIDAPASFIVTMRRETGFIAFIDAFVALSRQIKTETDLVFHAARVRRTVGYAWESLDARKLSFYDLSSLEISELASALEEAAAQLTLSFGLTARATPAVVNPALVVSQQTMSAEPDLVLFVALEEELAVLAKALGLTKTASTPEAVGTIDKIKVAVICPRAMGRVAAAVSMTSYLAKRLSRPKLILIVGIAGGFPENKTVQGHIIIADKVVDLAMRKVGDSTSGAEPNFRREEYPLLDQIKNQTLSDDFDTHSWSSRVAAELEWQSDRRPSLHYGSIGSADEVVASNEWRAQFLSGKGGEPKLLGVEMEAGGVCAAARRFKVPVSMLRVVSDQADPAKTDDQWRKLGMKTLADLIASISIGKIMAAID
ncbi:hypothetical protein NF700_17510 [Sphingomonadaceae bacterium OTU29MARTA1]|nr:hypothetical protein NF700_17510 [Sphingomonadaceae bacterium OTU29MARTA1]